MHTPRDSQGKVFHNPDGDAMAKLGRDTDTCVKCALCLPVCPTYSLHKTETQSPRGRVTLAQAMARGQLDPVEARPAFDACLTCMACQSVCPAKVPYGAIIDSARQLSGGPSRLESLAAGALAKPWVIRSLGALHKLGAAVPLPRRLARLRALPGKAGPSRAPTTNRDSTDKLPTTLLTGCLSPTFDRAAVDSLAALLNAVGRQVIKVDGCCGALSQHSGDRPMAVKLQSRLAERVAQPEGPVVHVASGCAAGVRDAAGGDTVGAVSARVVDPFVLLRDDGRAHKLAAADEEGLRILLHEPCTQRNALKAGGAVRDLLAAVPGLEITRLAGHGCCGAAGSHMLTQPDTATSLVNALLDPVGDPANFDVLVTANIGCAWHLRGALFDRNSGLEVMHPATLLARFLSA